MKRTNFILQAAVASAFGVTAAQAATFNGAGPTFVKEELAKADNTKVVSFAAGAHNTIVVNGTEGYINRLQPLNVKVVLKDGVQFGAAVAATGYSFGSYDANGAQVNSFAVSATGFVATVQGGGQVGDTFVTFSIDPTGVGLAKGGIDLGALQLQAIDTTLKAGKSVTADITLIDPTSNITLDSLTGKTIASAANAVSFEFTPTTSPEKIDVGTGSIEFTGTNVNDFNAGTIKLTLNTTFLNPGATAVAMTDVGNLVLNVAGLTSFDAFAHKNGVYLGTAVGVNSATSVATPSTASGASFQINPVVAGSGINAANFSLYFNSDDKTAIEEGTPTLQVTQGTVGGITGITATAATSMAAMVKNGYTAKYPLVFAGADSSLGVTYIRLVNNTSVAGKVFFTFKDAAGAVVGTANASVDVAGKEAKLWTDADIEALTGSLTAGKFYRLEISSTLPSSNVVTQAYVLTPNMSINNITAEKSN